MTEFSFEDLKNIKSMKYYCSKHGEILKPIRNVFFELKDSVLYPCFDLYCPICISEFMLKLQDLKEIGKIEYEAEFNDGYEPTKMKKKTTSEISD